MKIKYLLVLLVLISGCKEEKNTTKLDIGTYRAELKVNDTLSLPFNFEVISDSVLKIYNAEEVIKVTDFKSSCGF